MSCWGPHTSSCSLLQNLHLVTESNHREGGCHPDLLSPHPVPIKADGRISWLWHWTSLSAPLAAEEISSATALSLCGCLLPVPAPPGISLWCAEPSERWASWHRTQTAYLRLTSQVQDPLLTAPFISFEGLTRSFKPSEVSRLQPPCS